MPEAGWTSNSAQEPVFGKTKGSRRLDRFLLRGLQQVNGERALMATSRNIL